MYMDEIRVFAQNEKSFKLLDKFFENIRKILEWTIILEEEQGGR